MVLVQFHKLIITKMTSETKSMFFEREVPYEKLQNISKQELDKYYRKLGEEHIRNLEEVYDHKHPGQYQSLSSEDEEKSWIQKGIWNRRSVWH